MSMSADNDPQFTEIKKEDVERLRDHLRRIADALGEEGLEQWA